MSNELEQKQDENNVEGNALPGAKEELKNSKNINIRWVHVCWFFSVTFLLSGLGGLFENVIAGLASISWGLLLSPALNKALNKDLSWKIKVIIGLTIFIANGFYQSYRNAQIKEQNKLYLKSNKLRLNSKQIKKLNLKSNLLKSLLKIRKKYYLMQNNYSIKKTTQV